MDPRQDPGPPIYRVYRWVLTTFVVIGQPFMRVWSRERREDFSQRLTRWRSSIEATDGIGLYLTLLKISFQVIVDIQVKSCFPKNRFNPSVLLFLRSVPSLAMLMPVAIAVNQGPFPPCQTGTERGLMVFQTLAGGVRSIVIFFAMQQMPLNLAKMLLGTKPLFTSISAYFILGEAIPWYMVLAMGLMAGGISGALEPWDFGSQAFVNQTIADQTLTNQTESFLHMDELVLSKGYGEQFTEAAILLLIVMAVCSSVDVVIRKLKKTSTLSMLTSKDLVYLLLSGCWAIGWGMDFPTLTKEDICYLGLLTVLCIVISTLNVLSLKYEEAGRVVVLDRCTGIIGAFLSDVLWYDNPPKLNAGIGVGLVLVAISIIFAGKFFAARVKRTQQENTLYLEAIMAGRNESFSKVIDMNLNIVSLSGVSESLNPYTEDDEGEQEREQEQD